MRNMVRLVVLLATVAVGAAAADAEVDNRLTVAIGEPGSDSFAFGTELWAMGQITLMPAHSIVLSSKEVATDEDRLSLLEKHEVEAALIHSPVSEAYKDDMRTIMALWPQGISNENIQPAQVLVHKRVAADVVYLVTKAMFEHASFFKSAHARIGIGQPSEAIIGLDLPLHEGAYRYYEESGFGLEALTIAGLLGEKPSVNGSSGPVTATYRNFDDAALDSNEVDQIAAACRQAFEMGALLAVLGDLDSAGCEVYRRRLLDASERPSLSAVVTPAQPLSAGDDGESLFASPGGQGGPAIRWVPSSDGTKAVDSDKVKQIYPSGVLLHPTM